MAINVNEDISLEREQSVGENN